MFRPWLKEPEEPIAVSEMTTYTSTWIPPSKKRCEAEIVDAMKCYATKKWYHFTSKRFWLDEAVYWAEQLNLLTNKEEK